jgi:hypothetical protein
LGKAKIEYRIHSSIRVSALALGGPVTARGAPLRHPPIGDDRDLRASVELRQKFGQQLGKLSRDDEGVRRHFDVCIPAPSPRSMRHLCRRLDQAPHTRYLSDLRHAWPSGELRMAIWQADATESLSVELQDYIAAHRRHGGLLATTGQLMATGHRLTVACTCGTAFRRWITPDEATQNLNVPISILPTS